METDWGGSAPEYNYGDDYYGDNALNGPDYSPKKSKKPKKMKRKLLPFEIHVSSTKFKELFGKAMYKYASERAEYHGSLTLEVSFASKIGLTESKRFE